MKQGRDALFRGPAALPRLGLPGPALPVGIGRLDALEKVLSSGTKRAQAPSNRRSDSPVPARRAAITAMKPPADRRLDVNGTGVDLPAPSRPRYGVRWPFVLLVATILGIVSSTLAAQFALSMGKPPASWRSIVVLNCSYWYVWALFTPLIVWLSQHFRLERRGLLLAILIHLPSVALFSFAHIAIMGGVQWWLAASAGRYFSWWEEVKRSALMNFDWEMMTYWAIAGLSHAVLYYRESRDRELRASQLETKLIEAQMATLRQQLQPHFLFNTLHAISTLMHRDVEAADRTLMRLSDLLRMTLENVGQQEVTLQTELDFLSKYLEIEQTRFQDRLSVRYEVDPETLDAEVPRLILQPLVENAIKHGVSPRVGHGIIEIVARREEDRLCLEVRDNGVGLSGSARSQFRSGVGLPNTRDRLECLYGDAQALEFSEGNGGLTVRMRMPLQRSVVRATASASLVA